MQPENTPQNEPQNIQPPVSDPVFAQPPQSVPPVVTPPPKKSHKGLIALLIAVPLFLFIIMLAVGFAAFQGAQKKASDAKSASDINRQKAGINESSSDNNAITAKYSSEFETVCHGGSVSNAATFDKAAKPYKTNAFSKDDGDVSDRWSQVTLTSRNTSTADFDTPAEASVTACLKQKSGSAQKSQVCEFETSGQKVSIDYYSLKYEVVFRESKTGKQIGTGVDINGPATKCPMFASYNKSDPKLYASPDANALDTVVKSFSE